MSLRDPLGRGGDKSDEAPKDVETRRLPSSRPQLRGPRAGSAGRRQGALHCVQPEWSTGFVWPGCQTVLLTLEERWSDLGTYPWAAAAFAGLGGIGGLLCWHTCRARLSRKLDRQGLLAISHLQHGLYGPAVSDVLAS
ncbi:hypothetical protein M432DRAFT_592901 [Thermoascus aurantiacus ATCC 26904]